MTPSRSSQPRLSAGGCTGSSGGVTDVRVSRTSVIRSPQTEARGTIISMNVAIITDIRICIR